jgi:hypothetical protein
MLVALAGRIRAYCLFDNAYPSVEQKNPALLNLWDKELDRLADAGEEGEDWAACAAPVVEEVHVVEILQQSGGAVIAKSMFEIMSAYDLGAGKTMVELASEVLATKSREEASEVIPT